MNGPSHFRCDIDENPALAQTLPAHFYHSPEVFEEEYKQVFFKSWHYVCHESEVENSGSYVTTKIRDQRFFVIRGKDGQLRAFANVCPHRGHILLEGSGKRNIIVCPYHAWSFDQEGALKVPGCAGFEGINYSEFGLTELRLEVFLGFVFINMDPDAPSFKSRVPGLEEDIRNRVARFDELVIDAHGANQGPAPEGEIKCNWKLLAENYQECYHCSTVHPGISAIHDTKKFILELFENHTRSVIPLRENIVKMVYPISDEDEQRDAVFWFVWPNIAFTSLAGRPNFSVFRLDPVGPELTSNFIQVLHLPGDYSEAYLKRGEWMATETGPEDISVLESTQLGLHQLSFNRGRFIYRNDAEALGGSGERGPHWFARKLAQVFDQIDATPA